MKWHRTLAVALTSLAATGGIAIAAHGQSAASTVTPSDAAVPDPAIERDFAVLSRAAATEDSLDGQRLAKIMDDPAVASAGVAWTRTRHAATAAGFDLFVIPSRGGLCLLSTSPETGADLACGVTADVADHGIQVRTVVGEGTMIAGIVPDGVSAVSVAGNTARVVENTFLIADGATGSTRLLWAGPRGDQSVAVPPSPLDVSPPAS